MPRGRNDEYSQAVANQELKAFEARKAIQQSVVMRAMKQQEKGARKQDSILK